MEEIARCLPDGGDWCSALKAQTLASIVLGNRPRVTCEVGVWMGGSMIPILLALRALRQVELDDAAARTRAAAVRTAATGISEPVEDVPVVRRIAVAIDAWSSADSAVGQSAVDAAWWASADHATALRVFRERLERHGVADLCEVVQSSSGTAPVPRDIDLLHVDGNHAEQATVDVARFGTAVSVGGILVLDDLHWAGGHVTSARDLARDLGFRELYRLDTGIVMQRTRTT